MSRRTAATLALLLGALALAGAVFAFVTDFPRGLIVIALLLVAPFAAWFGLLRRGAARLAGLVLGALLLGLAIGVTISGGNSLGLLIALVALLLATLAAREAFRPEAALAAADPPRNPVLFVNPRSGEGRAGRVGLAAAARERGFEVVELGPGEDLAQLVRAAVERRAGGLAMAGGDGSQALVASIAAEHELPYACIPAGTRNHFALDLGVEREDVVGALDAFGPGAGERYVDLGEVNGRVFVNNVSLGVYAEAVGQEGYREAKLRTLVDMLAQTLGPEASEPPQLRWRDPDGAPQRSTALILVSNNVYLLGPTLGSGTRPRLDAGVLGIVDFHPPAASSERGRTRWRELSAPELVVECDASVPVGVDGEAVTLESPLRFTVHSRALRVRIAPNHPGASPSAEIPRGPAAAVRELLALALSR